MKEQLSPCPNCGERCASFHGASVDCINEDDCSYRIVGHTKPQVIAMHERLAGVCEWIEEEDCWATGCGVYLTEPASHAIEFCGGCGKKVKVKI